MAEETGSSDQVDVKIEIKEEPLFVEASTAEADDLEHTDDPLKEEIKDEEEVDVDLLKDEIIVGEPSCSSEEASRKMLRQLTLLVLGATIVMAQRRLALPDPRSCANRVRHASYRDARGVAHAYFFSWEHGPTRSLEVDWLDARNICRRHCMDAVSLETPQENDFIKQRISRGNIRYIWTSGRKCNFNGCDRPDLQPANVNGWFWSGSGAKIGPTTQRNSGDWSNTGGFGQAQPDNREAAQGNDESCLSILNNFYNDGVKWHDVACHHLKPFVCEDSDELLNFVRSRNPGVRL